MSDKLLANRARFFSRRAQRDDISRPLHLARRPLSLIADDTLDQHETSRTLRRHRARSWGSILSLPPLSAPSHSLSLTRGPPYSSDVAAPLYSYSIFLLTLLRVNHETDDRIAKLYEPMILRIEKKSKVMQTVFSKFLGMIHFCTELYRATWLSISQKRSCSRYL